MNGDITIQQLLDDLQSPDWQVRYQAVDRLKIVGDTRAVEPLIGVLADEHDTVRFLAAHALGILGDSRAVEPLVHTLHTSDEDTRWAAARALVEIGADAVPALITLLRGDDAVLRDIAADVLGSIGDERALEPLWHALAAHGKADFRQTRRFGAASGLEKFGAAAAPAFISLLDHEAPILRARAAAGLGYIRSEDGVPRLAALLHDDTPCTKDKRVCDVAARALEKIGTRGALQALEQWHT